MHQQKVAADSGELLPTLHIYSFPITVNDLNTIKNADCRIVSYTFYRYYIKPSSLVAGTRNLNYYTNLALGSSSIGFQNPHINGANTDGNVIFIDGVRMLPSSLTEFNIIGFK